MIRFACITKETNFATFFRCQWFTERLINSMKVSSLLQVLCFVSATVNADIHDPDSWQPLVHADYFRAPIKSSYGGGGFGLLGG